MISIATRFHGARPSRTITRETRRILQRNGADDTVIVDLPKGTYVVAFHYRLTPPNRTQATQNLFRQRFRAWRRRKWVAAVFSLGFLLGLAALTIFGYFGAATQPRPG